MMRHSALPTPSPVPGIHITDIEAAINYWRARQPSPDGVALPPPTPTAPPMPFGYLGRYQDAAKPIIFLTRSDRVLLVSEGDVIEGAYRVDGIVGSRLGLTYLPLNIRQSLDIGPAE